MSVALTSEAERLALPAQDLIAFSGTNLLHLKREIATLLNQIGRSGIFDQYTAHDISHINEMLHMLEWIVPAETKAIMTPADWFMTVLAVYLHDLGMLVTNKEYADRDHSGFSQFCTEVLFAGPSGTDYRAQAQRSYPNLEDRERFLYQEFVRHTHAARIAAWILGEASTKLGVAPEVSSALDDLLRNLLPVFRRDLAMVCESHHLDDLGDTGKYKPSQPYGSRREETANLQFAAILLRTADLLHITRDRVPAITYRIISPTDPISQVEWAKQAAVHAVRPGAAVIHDEKTGALLPPITIEVHALFRQAEAYFGLTSYLAYADRQLKKSHEWAAATSKAGRARHAFPWQGIDDTNVEAEGFLKQAFSFQLDHSRILDLLTGHTLYNDSNVVVRELVQNSIDAIRLQREIDSSSSAAPDIGTVLVHWDSQERVLSVSDDGTGMSQDIIERHLLRVGSSRYQDAEFRKRFPAFSAISRFGIGVLSCFMIADDVDVFTCHPDESEARHVALRSVHGRYLIKLLRKDTDPTATKLCPHGTLVRLRLRTSAKVSNNIRQAVERWFPIPGCTLKVQIDDGDPVQVGAATPRDALAAVLQRLGYRVGNAPVIDEATGRLGVPAEDDERLAIVERVDGCVRLAYAVEWSDYFKEWTLLDVSQHQRSETPNDRPRVLLGTCVEGVRVEFGSPGYDGVSIAAIANTTGLSAPKTDVARARIEVTPEYNEALKSIYRLYATHIVNELESLKSERGFSLTWATTEVGFLLRALLSTRNGSPSAVSYPLLSAELDSVPALLSDDGMSRRAVSVDGVRALEQFWTCEGALLTSAERLMREARSSSSLPAVVAALGIADDPLPAGLILSSYGAAESLYSQVFANREIEQIVLARAQRRVDLLWTVRNTGSSRWMGIPERVAAAVRRTRRDINDLYTFTEAGEHYGRSDVQIATDFISVAGVEDEFAVVAGRRCLILYGTPIQEFLVGVLTRAATSTKEADLLLAHCSVDFARRLVKQRYRGSYSADKLRVQLRKTYSAYSGIVDFSGLVGAVAGRKINSFDPSAWSRDVTKES